MIDRPRYVNPWWIVPILAVAGGVALAVTARLTDGGVGTAMVAVGIVTAVVVVAAAALLVWAFWLHLDRDRRA